jgi:hypothetical protein
MLGCILDVKSRLSERYISLVVFMDIGVMYFVNLGKALPSMVYCGNMAAVGLMSSGGFGGGGMPGHKAIIIGFIDQGGIEGRGQGSKSSVAWNRWRVGFIVDESSRAKQGGTREGAGGGAKVWLTCQAEGAEEGCQEPGVTLNLIVYP